VIGYVFFALIVFALGSALTAIGEMFATVVEYFYGKHDRHGK
jgi:hypothetical protein